MSSPSDNESAYLDELIADARVGTKIGDYVIESVLGRGGMGVVYRAVDETTGAVVALKLMLPELAANRRFRERFIREAEFGPRLAHPNIVPTFATGEAGGELFIAMQLVRGMDMKGLIAEKGRLDIRTVLSLFKQAASALDAAHVAGVVHRDVKPQNILIELDPDDSQGTGHAFLTDFGLIRPTGTESSVSRTGEVFGSIQYMSPEQIEGLPADGRADVYSLACVLYEALTGEVPFDRENEVAVLWAHVHEDPPRVSSKRKEILGGTDAVLVQAMSKHPDDRYLTCGEFISAFEESLGKSLTRSIMPIMRPLVARIPRPKTEREVWSPNFFPELSRVRKASRHVSWMKIGAFVTAVALLLSVQLVRKGGIPRAASQVANALGSIGDAPMFPDLGHTIRHHDVGTGGTLASSSGHKQSSTNGARTDPNHPSGSGVPRATKGRGAITTPIPNNGLGQDSPPQPFADDGTCEMVGLEIPAPSSNIRPYVPDEFKLNETAEGVSLLYLETEQCKTSVNRGPVIDHYLSSGFVPVLDEGGQPGFFDFGWITTSRTYFRAYQSVGFGSLVTDVQLNITTNQGRANSASANVPWDTSPYSYTAATGNRSCSCKDHSIFWALGQLGLVKADYQLQWDHSDAGTGTAQFPDGTLFAKLAGATRASGEAFFGHMTYQGTVSLASH